MKVFSNRKIKKSKFQELNLSRVDIFSTHDWYFDYSLDFRSLGNGKCLLQKCKMAKNKPEKNQIYFTSFTSRNILKLRTLKLKLGIATR